MATYTPVLNSGPSNPQNLFGTNPTPVNSGLATIPGATIPGFSNLNRGATNAIASNLGGLPSPAVAQRANAYFGASSGMPGSDFVRNRGFDLYGQQADQYRQRGIDDFLKLISTYSGTLMPTAGQNIQAREFNATQDFNNRQALADEYNRQGQNNLDALKWGVGRPWNSRNNGDTYDRLNNRVGNETRFNRGIFI